MSSPLTSLHLNLVQCEVTLQLAVAASATIRTKYRSRYLICTVNARDH